MAITVTPRIPPQSPDHRTTLWANQLRFNECHLVSDRAVSDLSLAVNYISQLDQLDRHQTANMFTQAMQTLVASRRPEKTVQRYRLSSANRVFVEQLAHFSILSYNL